MTAEELLDAEVAAADQAALTKAFNDAKRNDVKGLLKAQREGRTYEYMDKWIPSDVKRRLSEERKKAPKLHARRFNHAGKRVPQKRTTKNGGHSNGMSSIELSEASLSAFLAKEKTGSLSRGRAVTRDSATPKPPRSTGDNTRNVVLEENKKPRQLISNIQDNLRTTTKDNTDTKKVSSSKSSAKETATMSPTTSVLKNNRENISPTTSITSGTKEKTTTSYGAMRANLKPIHGERSTNRDPLIRASSNNTDQKNVKVGTSSVQPGNRVAAETRVNLCKVDKSSTSLSISSSIKCTEAAEPKNSIDSENRKHQSFIGGVKLRPVKARQELPPVRKLGPKVSSQSFSVSPEIATAPAQSVVTTATSSSSKCLGTGAASSIPEDNNNARCDAAEVVKEFEAANSPVEKKEEMKEIVSSPTMPRQSSETTRLKKIGAVVPPSSVKKEVSVSIAGPKAGGDVSGELEMAKYKTSIQDGVVAQRVELPPLTSMTPSLTQDHIAKKSPLKANNSARELLDHKLRVTEYSPEIQDTVAAAEMKPPLLTPLPAKEEDGIPSTSNTLLTGSEPSEELGVTEYTSNIKDVFTEINPEPNIASLSIGEKAEDCAFVENSEETSTTTTKPGRVRTFFGKLLSPFRTKEKLSKYDEISNPSTFPTNYSAAQESLTQVEQEEHHEIEEEEPISTMNFRTATDTTITTVEEEPPEEEEDKVFNADPPTAPVTSTTHYASKSLKRPFRFGKRLKKIAKRRKKTKSLSSDNEDISNSSVTSTDLLPDNGKITTNVEEDPSTGSTSFGTMAAHHKSSSKKKKAFNIFGRNKNKRMKITTMSNVGGDEICLSPIGSSASAEEKPNSTTTIDTPPSIAQRSTSASTKTMASALELNGKKKRMNGVMKGKQHGDESQLVINNPTAKKAAVMAVGNVSSSKAASDHTTSNHFSTSVGDSKNATVISRKDKKTKRNAKNAKEKNKKNKKSSNSSRLASTVQQLSSINLAGIAENALSKFMGEAKPKEVTTQDRIAREQAAFERSKQQQYEALRLPPAGLLGLRHMKVASPQASTHKDSAMALNKSSFRRRVGIERRASKHQCNTEMFCEVSARIWCGHEYDACSSVSSTQYAFLKLTEGILWMGKAGAVMKEVALISKTCTLSTIQHIENEGGKECVLIIINDPGCGSLNENKRYIQLCASTNEETKDFYQLLSLSNGC